MPSPLLTIVIPTYNRAELLSVLLKTLAVELRGLEGKVRVVIGDNASPDHTPIVTEAFLKVYPSAHILRHLENLGADENFCCCIDQVQTRFFWMIGDDDLPKTGVLRNIVSLLECQDADIIYLQSEWMPHITNANDGEPVSTLTSKMLSREAFAREVNVWVTFISSMVVNLKRLNELNPGLSIRRFTGTNLVQLGWILPLLMSGSRFQIVKQRCILATSGNTGGYTLFRVFGTNFPAILSTICGSTSQEYRLIIKNLSWIYIPGLLWATRFGNMKNFISENVIESLAPLKKFPAYWFVIFPILKFPRLFAIPFFLISKLYSLTH